MTLFRTFLFFVFITLTGGCSLKQMPTQCQSGCVQPYGAVLGISEQVVQAYSNCQPACVNYEPNRFNDVYTGVKWQCVEYARRWLLINKGVVFGDVDMASDIWDKTSHVTNVATNKRIPLESHLNGSSTPPQAGDLLVYARAFNNTGHVAVITSVDYEKGIIRVAEQNYYNELWPDHFSRTIEYLNLGKQHWVLDGYLLGWKQINEQGI
jgi:hypothetical protein